MGEFIKNSPFRFWCQKVLPMVYDDSLSYYELLCKVVHKLNELAENQNNLSETIKQVAKDLDDFKNQVPGMIEKKVEEWLNNYITTKGLVNSVNGMKGDVILTAADVGAIANVNGSVKNNNIAAGAVTADKLANGVIPTKLPNPRKLTFSGAVTGEYDGSKEVNIDIPAGGGGGTGGAVDSVNGMTGAVVLKKLTANEGLTMSGGDGYNGSAEQSVGIAPGGVNGDKIADGAITAPKIANNAVTSDKVANGAVTADKIADGTVTAEKMASGVVPPTWHQSFTRGLGGIPSLLSIVVARCGDIAAVSFSTGDKVLALSDETITVQLKDQSVDLITCSGAGAVVDPKTGVHVGTIDCKLSIAGGVGKVGTFKFKVVPGLTGNHAFVASVTLLPL